MGSVLVVVSGLLAVLSGVGLLLLRRAVPAAVTWCAVVGGLVMAAGALTAWFAPAAGAPVVVVGGLVLATALSTEVRASP